MQGAREGKDQHGGHHRVARDQKVEYMRAAAQDHLRGSEVVEILSEKAGEESGVDGIGRPSLGSSVTLHCRIIFKLFLESLGSPI